MQKILSIHVQLALTTRNRTKDTLISAVYSTVRCSANWAMVSTRMDWLPNWNNGIYNASEVNQATHTILTGRTRLVQISSIILSPPPAQAISSLITPVGLGSHCLRISGCCKAAKMIQVTVTVTVSCLLVVSEIDSDSVTQSHYTWTRPGLHSEVPSGAKHPFARKSLSKVMRIMPGRKMKGSESQLRLTKKMPY